MPDEVGGEASIGVLTEFSKLLPRIFDEELRDLLFQFADTSEKIYLSASSESDAADMRREEARRQMGSLNTRSSGSSMSGHDWASHGSMRVTC